MKQTDQRTTVKAVSNKIIGGAHPRALSPRRWGKQKGRSMIEMLGVLAIIGVLSITALVGFTYAMNKHRANETIYDVMLRGTNVPMVDENYASKPSGHEFRFPDLPAGTYYPMTTKKDAGSSYYVEATGVTYRVCELILKMNPTDIDQIVVGNTVYQGDSDICGTNDGLAMKFCFGEDGTICDGTGHGGSSGGSGSGSSGGTSGGSGSGTDPVDPCEGIIASTDCSITADETDSNGCVTVKKITCGNDTYCSGSTCEPCPAAETCAGESCCALTGPNDVCGRPTKEVGTVTTVTHSDLNANGCCETTTEESCSLNPVTPRTCTPTCDGTCESDGSCRPTCETGYSYNETAGQCCEDLTETACQKLVPASSGVCPRLEHVSTEGFPCTTTDGQSGTCQSGMCELPKTTCQSNSDCEAGRQCSYNYQSNCTGSNCRYDERICCISNAADPSGVDYACCENDIGDSAARPNYDSQGNLLGYQCCYFLSEALNGACCPSFDGAGGIVKDNYTKDGKNFIEKICCPSSGSDAIDGHCCGLGIIRICGTNSYKCYEDCEPDSEDYGEACCL